MGSISSEDALDLESERLDSYSLSADVSESESCSSVSGRHYDADDFSSLSASSPLPDLPPSLIGGRDVVFWDQKRHKRDVDLSEVEMMKERFAKLLLGEDMSGGGKGACTALAISNAITNLSATIFGELWRLHPLPPQKKATWLREMEWLLCVSDSIVELIPATQEFPGGGGCTFEVMVARPRSDLYVNLPALKKLDGLLLAVLDGFQETEFSYVDRGISVDVDVGACPSSLSSSGRPSVRQEDKWWLPCPKVQPNGLSGETRKRIQQCRDCVNQILKAARAINSSVLADMEIPDVYLESLPKSAKACLGNVIYHYIIEDQFAPENLLDCLDLSSEYLSLEVANILEAAIHIWTMKDQKKSPSKKTRRRPWGGKVKVLGGETERNHHLVQRAENLLECLRLRFPCLPQTVLDTTKIQYNTDVGQSILESYSRVLESVAFNIIARIDHLLYIDDLTKRSAAESVSPFNRGAYKSIPLQKKFAPSPISVQNSPYSSPFVTPRFYLSPPLAGSTRDSKAEKLVSADMDGLWLYSGGLSSRKDSGDAPDRDKSRILF